MRDGVVGVDAKKPKGQRINLWPFGEAKTKP